MRDVVTSIELGKSHGPYRLHQEVAAALPTQTLPHPSYAAVAAPLTAADFGDSAPGVSGVSGAGVSGDLVYLGYLVYLAHTIPKLAPPPPGTLRLGQCPANWGTSTALEVALQVMVLCR